MSTTTEASAHVLEMLRANSTTSDTFPDGEVWGLVHLADSKPRGWSKQQFAGHLSDLKSQGLYAPITAAIGRVKLDR